MGASAKQMSPLMRIAAECHTAGEVSHRVSHRENAGSAGNPCVSGEVSHCHTVTRGEYVPFPVEHLPPALRELAAAGSESIGCDPAMIAVPGLATLAAAVGTTRVVQVKEGWREPSALWGAVIAESGSRKSPAFELATRPIQDVQREYHLSHEEDRRRRQEAGGAVGRVPDGPPCKRLLIADATVDAVAPILRDNPRGVLVACDELDTWFQSFTRYSAGGASDMPRWLSLYNGASMQVDRKTGGSIFVPRALASICGTIQPSVFGRAMNRAARDSGLAARLLLALPPRRKRQWTDSTVPDGVSSTYGVVVRALVNLTHDQGEGWDSRARVLPLSRDALSLFVGHVNKLGARSEEVPGAEERAILSKLEAIPARLALVYELASSCDPDSVQEIGREAMASAVALGSWFADEVIRVFSCCGEMDRQRECRELLEWIGRKGGAVSARDLQRHNHKRYPTSEHADIALAGLVAGGLGEWAGEGRARRFRMGRCDSVTV